MLPQSGTTTNASIPSGSQSNLASSIVNNSNACDSAGLNEAEVCFQFSFRFTSKVNSDNIVTVYRRKTTRSQWLFVGAGEPSVDFQSVSGICSQNRRYPYLHRTHSSLTFLRVRALNFPLLPWFRQPLTTRHRTRRARRRVSNSPNSKTALPWSLK